MKPHGTPQTCWSLVREIGLERASRPATEPPLCHPSFAAQVDDHSVWIVDELGTEKLVPFRLESRTVCVDGQGNIKFDSVAMGIDDGFGCPLADGCLAILRRTKWELLVVSPAGARLDCLPLSSFSKRMPRHVAWTDEATFLVVFCNRAGEVDLIEIDRQGRLLWFLPPDAAAIGVAGSIQRLPNDNLLIADPFRHVVIEIDRTGSIVWQFGEAEAPSGATLRLASPGSAQALPDGGRLIADTRNHRILLVAPNGAITQLQPEHEHFCDPAHATQLRNGHYLICDTGNRRVVEMDHSGHIVRQVGGAVARRHFLSYPRSVELIGSDTYLVADTAHDRVVALENGKVTERPAAVEPPLFWPRCVRALPSGALLIADGRNGRIVEVAADGRLIRELSEVQLDERRPLRDPHDVRMLANGHLLITDSPQDIVVETDWDGHVYRVIGTQPELDLKDPHSAQLLDDGRIVIADTGRHRILIAGPNGKRLQKISAIATDQGCLRLNFPRYAEVMEDGTLIIADTGNNRVLAVTLEGNLIWQFSHVPQVDPSRLNQPRWVHLVDQNELIVCDHFHHRILHVKRAHGST